MKRWLAVLAVLAGVAVIGVALGLRARGSGPVGTTPPAPTTTSSPGDADAGDSLAEALATADPAALAVGQAAYRRECASCHGARGEGQPAWQIPLAGGSLPAPPHDSSGHTWHHPDGLLLDIIAYGGAIYSPTSAMPAFAGKLSPAEMRAVLAYIKTFWGERERAAQQEQTLQWELMQRQVTPDAEPSATALPSD